MKTLFATTALLACLTLAAPAQAHEGEAHGTEASSEVKSNVAVPADEEAASTISEDEAEEGQPALEPKAESETDYGDEDTMGTAE